MKLTSSLLVFAMMMMMLSLVNGLVKYPIEEEDGSTLVYRFHGSGNRVESMPYLVLVTSRHGPNGPMTCLGTVLTENLILTAARCVVRTVAFQNISFEALEVKVRVGNLSIEHESGEFRYDVQTVLFHHNFTDSPKKPEFYLYDFAMLVLKGSLDLHHFASQAILDNETELFETSSHIRLSQCEVVGKYGKSGPLVLIPMPLKNQDFCSLYHPLRPEAYCHETQWCAQCTDPPCYVTCEEDLRGVMVTTPRGSPVICPLAGSNNQYVVVGLVTHPFEECASKVLGIFPRHMRSPGYFHRISALREVMDETALDCSSMPIKYANYTKTPL